MTLLCFTRFFCPWFALALSCPLFSCPSRSAQVYTKHSTPFRKTDSKWRMAVVAKGVGASLNVGMQLKGDRPPVTFSLIKVLRLPLFRVVCLCRAVFPLCGVDGFCTAFTVDVSSSGNVTKISCESASRQTPACSSWHKAQPR